MQLDSLHIAQLRNLLSLELHPGPGFNFISGTNGSGKTSILEAIHLLATGRSFRSPQAKTLISVGASYCRVSALVSPGADQGVGVSAVRLGVERSSAGGLKMRLAETDCHSLALFAKSLALQLMNSNSYDLLEAEPSGRRNFLNWIMFHVEHSFHGIWQRFVRALQQRNAVLRTPGARPNIDILAWNQEIINMGQMIDAQRKALLQELLPIFSEVVGLLFDVRREINIQYQQGWSQGFSLEAALAASLTRDLALGYTTVGPQRSDLSFLMDGLPVKSLLSRGELKLFIAALFIARARLFHAKEGRRCIFLIDDLHAELDERAAAALLSCLGSLQTQVFITGIDTRGFSPWLQGASPHFKLASGVLCAA